MLTAASCFFFSDFENLLVRFSDIILQAVQQHQPAVIPCRPTSLDVNVSLWKDGTLVSSSIQHITTVQYDVSLKQRPSEYNSEVFHECFVSLAVSQQLNSVFVP